MPANDPEERLGVEVEIRIRRGNSVLLDRRTADVLRAIELTGSIMSSAKLLGLPYSRVWRILSALEGKLGTRVIRPRRGGSLGGGTELTEEGIRLLRIYESYERRLGFERELEPVRGESRGSVFLIMGSHDLLLESAIGSLRGRGYGVEAHWVGSYGGLLSLSLGEADAAGIHLLDVRSSRYNVPVVREMFPSGVAVIRGYRRELGWVYRDRFDIEDLISGRLRIANRNKGSGTRLLIDRILRELLGEGVKLSEVVRGYGREYFTHSAACRAVADGRADFTISIRPMAERYGLKFSGICWEDYDLAVLEESLDKGILDLILEEIARMGPPAGYQLPEDMGSRII